MSDRRVAWVRAQLDATEAAAKAASPGPWHLNAEHDEVLAVDDIEVAEIFALSNRQLRATAEHIVLHDPAAVLADVEAKRAILDYAERLFDNAEKHPDDFASKGGFLAMHGVVKWLAEGFRGRPGYEEAMRDE